jgi:hypothetical protein
VSRRLAVLLLAAAAVAGAAPPPVIPWQAAGERVGEIVTVEGEVAAVRTSADTCILEFAPGDARAFRVVLLIPMLSSAPRQCEQSARGKRVRVSGRVQRFQGRPEMVLRNPGQIEGVADEGQPAAAPTREEPAPTTLPRAEEPVAPVPVAPAEGRSCDEIRGGWRATAARATAESATLRRCLAAATYHCRAESAALRAVLSALEAVEQQVEAACR